MAVIGEFIVPGILTAVLSYLIGSISFSIVFTLLFEKADIRTMGSGNAGMTNVLRSVGAKAGVFTFIFDFAKGVAAVFVGRLIFSWWLTSQAAGVGNTYEIVQYGAYLAGFFCVMGHIFPVYFGFKGGKGVLTSWAIILLIDWRAFIAVILVFIFVFLVSKIVSLASICAASSFPLFTFIFNYLVDYHGGINPVGDVSSLYPLVSVFITLVMGSIVVVKHRENIKRILNGTEKKISVKGKK